MPGETLPTRRVAIEPDPDGADASRIAARLREMNPPLVARVERDALMVDLRTVEPESDETVSAHLLRALGIS